jgi:NADH:ubiquinone reductase (H+-translocating)
VSYRDRQRLADIQAAIEAIRAHPQRGSLSDALVFDAVRIRLPVIGEAVKALPAELLNAQPGIPWSQIAGMRDHLARRSSASRCRPSALPRLSPQVAGGMVEPRHICVSLPRRLRNARFVLGTVNHVDPRQKVVSWSGPEGASGQVGYDRLILTAGSVNRLLPIPGVADYAHGFRTIAEAIYLRDHITRQLELAEVAADPAERAARCTFVVVGAGYTGTEVTAHGQGLTSRLARALPGLARQEIRWMLLDLAPRVLAELDPRLSRTAERVLRRRGVEVLTGESVAEAGDGAVQLTTGDKVVTRSLIWCVGVRADPLVDGLDLGTYRGRLDVDPFMKVPGAPDIWACGDCAAVPDLTRPGQVCGMTAQHAQRQGKLVARNVAASLGHGTSEEYKHRDLGFLVDLGGLAGAANPLHIPLSGPARARRSIWASWG